MRRLSALLPLALAAPAWAHPGHDHGGAPGWTLDPVILVPLGIAAILFAAGWQRLARRSHRGRSALRRRAWWFGTGLFLLASALVSPLHEAGERSFAAHMTEHELIMLAAAPLLILSRPLAIMLWAFPARARTVLGSVSQSPIVSAPWSLLTAPVIATFLQAVALWAWHMPALFDRALASEGWHAAQHLSFLIAALLFWTAMLARATPPLLAALCLVVTSIVSGALGAFMALASSPWYAGYAKLGMAPFGLSAAEDQQLAGLLMWVPGGLVHAGAALLLVRRLLTAAQTEAAHAV